MEPAPGRAARRLGGGDRLDATPEIETVPTAEGSFTRAAATLVALGYTDVWELGGGMRAWDASGRSLAHAGTAPSP